MIKRSFKRIISTFMALILITGMLAVGSISVQAANETAITVTVAEVKRSYTTAQSYLDLINKYRVSSGKTKWTMDKESLESAMIRATELSVYVSTDTPNGKNGLDYLTGASRSGCGQIIGYEVRSSDAFFADSKANSESNNILLDSDLKSVGIGYVTVRGHNFLCILASDKTPTTVANSVMTQPDVEVDQDIRVFPSLLKNPRNVYAVGQGVYCGSSVKAYIAVTNTTYESIEVWLTADHMIVNSSDSTLVKYDGGRLHVLGPGMCSVTIYHPDSPTLRIITVLEGLTKKFTSCSFTSIADQYYTGQPITPTVTVKNTSTGKVLTLGTDYSVSYINNVNIGTATVSIKGMGQYVGESKTLKFNIVSKGSSASLNVNVSTTLSYFSLGQSTQITAQASGGKGPYKYTYAYAPYGTTNFTVLVSNSSSSSYTFKPTAAGKYYLRAIVRDSENREAFKSAVVEVSSSLTCKAKLSTTSIEAGNPLTVSLSYSGGSSPYKFAFYAQKPSSSTWICLKDFSAETSVTFKPTTAGKYKICVKCKSSSNVVAKDYADLTVTGSSLRNVSEISTRSIDLGQSVTLKGSAAEGTAPYQYAYYYKHSTSKNWTTQKSYSTTSRVDVKPAKTGTYNVCIKVKDAKGIVVKKYFDVIVKAKLVNTSSITPVVIGKGSTVKVTCTANGGSGSYQYAVFYKKTTSKNYTKARDYASGTTVNIKPAYTGKYDIRVKAKDSNNSIVNKDFVVTVNAALSNTSKLSSTSIKKGQSITAACSASGGSGTYQYAVYYKQSTQSSWTLARNYSAGTSVTFTPKTATKYNVRVKAKDSVGKIVNKDFVVTVS